MNALERNFVEWLHSSTGSRGERPRHIPDVLTQGKVRCVFQPLINLKTNRVFAYEALVRSSSPSYTNPPALFEEAIRGHCCGALGRLIREIALAGCPNFPLFLNIHPNEFDEGWLVRPDDPIFRHEHPIYLEITESVPLSHFVLCRSVLREVRHKGILLAVDDLGAGYSNLRYIADLAPEVVKLDRGLVSNLAGNARSRMLVRAIVQLCTELGAQVVAEGVETSDEDAAVRDSGAHFGQGYLYARPDFPPPTL